MPSQNNRESTLGMDSKVTVKLIFAVVPVVLLLAGIWYEQRGTKIELQEIKAQLWTIPDQTIWAERLATKNPTMTVPSPRDVVDTLSPRQPKVDHSAIP